MNKLKKRRLITGIIGALAVVVIIVVVVFSSQTQWFQGFVPTMDVSKSKVTKKSVEPISEEPISEVQLSEQLTITDESLFKAAEDTTTSEQLTMGVDLPPEEITYDITGKTDDCNWPVPIIGKIDILPGENDSNIQGIKYYFHQEPHIKQRLLGFVIKTCGCYYKQENPIYLRDFHFKYKDCVGDSNNRPKKEPYLLFPTIYGPAIIGTDSNQDGVFEFDEIVEDYRDELALFAPGTYSQPEIQLAVAMDTDSTMCPAGSRGQVVLTDLMWKDSKGRTYLHSNDADLPNPILDLENSDENAILFE